MRLSGFITCKTSSGLLGVKPREREGGTEGRVVVGWGGERYGPQLLSVNNKLSHLTSETVNSRRKDEEQTSNRKTGKLMIVGEFLQLWAWSGGGAFSRGG